MLLLSPVAELLSLCLQAARFIIATVEELVRASESLVPGSAASGPGLVNRPETRLQLELLHILIALRSLLRPFPGRLDQFLNTSLHQHALELSASGHLSEAVGYAFLIRSRSVAADTVEGHPFLFSLL